MSLDETSLSNGDVYTILTNKAAHGGDGSRRGERHSVGNTEKSPVETAP